MTLTQPPQIIQTDAKMEIKPTTDKRNPIEIVIILFCTLWLTNLHAREIKVLAIGNSFSDDALEHYLYQLGADHGDTLTIGNLAIAGASLELHHNNALNDAPAYSYRKIVHGARTVSAGTTLKKGLMDEEWDYISLQQVSHNAGRYETYFPYLTHLLQYVKAHAGNPDATIILHMTWAYAQDCTHPGFAAYGNDQEKMFAAILETTSKIAAELNIPIVVPAGTAIQNARTSSLGDTLCVDGFHLERTYGRYTAACTWYEALTGHCVVGNPFKPEQISECQAFIAQISAHFAVINAHKVTHLSACGK